MKSLFAIVMSATLVSATASSVQAGETARRLVCPPQLSYCYYVEKPIQSGPNSEDAYQSAKKVVDCMEREIEVRWTRPYADLHCNQYLLPTR